MRKFFALPFAILAAVGIGIVGLIMGGRRRAQMSLFYTAEALNEMNHVLRAES